MYYILTVESVEPLLENTINQEGHFRDYVYPRLDEALLVYNRLADDTRVESLQIDIFLKKPILFFNRGFQILLESHGKMSRGNVLSNIPSGTTIEQKENVFHVIVKDATKITDLWNEVKMSGKFNRGILISQNANIVDRFGENPDELA